MFDLISAVAAFTLSVFTGLPSGEELAQIQPSSNVIVEDKQGERLFLLGQADRNWLPLKDTPQVVIDAVLSAEDSRYFENEAAIDPKALLRASFQNLSRIGKKRLIGGSTIPQQLAKLYHSGMERSVKRKLQEGVIASRMVSELGKERVLELYLNEIYLGRGVYGFARAAEVYFGKDVQQLDEVEAATLASLIRAPSKFSREDQRTRLLNRRNWVLDQMVSNGKFSAFQNLLAKRRKLELTERPRDPYVTDYYQDLVRRELFDMFGADALAQGGMTVKVAYNPVAQKAMEDSFSRALLAMDTAYSYRGSFKRPERGTFRAPLNWKLGKVTSVTNTEFRVAGDDGALCTFRRGKSGAVRLPKSGLRRLVRSGESVYFTSTGSTCALQQVPDISGAGVSVDRVTGEVVAIVGGFDYAVTPFNRAVQALRQPGSTIKPLTYFSALNAGYRLTDPIGDIPLEIELERGRYWRPQNADGKFAGMISLNQGLYRSRNVATLALAREMGFKRFMRNAKFTGLSRNMPREWTVVLGTGGASAMDMAGAYTAMLSVGQPRIPYAVRQVHDASGQLLVDMDRVYCPVCRPQSRFARRMDEMREASVRRSPAALRQLRESLRNVVARGTARRIRDRVPSDTIGKTGTTNDFREAWFVGETSAYQGRPLITAVYVGHDKPVPIAKGASGGRLAAPIFADFMDGLLNPGANLLAASGIGGPEVRYTKQALNLRNAPTLSGSRVLTTMPKGSAFEIVSCGSRWCEGRYNGLRGFASARPKYLGTKSGRSTVTRFADVASFMRSSGGTFTPRGGDALFANSLAFAAANAAQAAQAEQAAPQPKARTTQFNTKRTRTREINGRNVVVRYNF